MKIKYQDALTYLTIRSFHNSSTYECFPAYETIAERAGVSRSFVASSLKRLKDSDLIQITSGGKDISNRYKFAKFVVFEKIPYEIFDIKDLPLSAKSMLICLRQFFNEGWLSTTSSIVQIAEYLGLSYKTVYTQIEILKSKAYIEERGSGKRCVMVLTDRIQWKSEVSISAPMLTLSVG